MSGVEEEPSSYHSGRVRIIGAEPAGDSMRDATGPVVEEHPDLPHWNDAPTGQVPAVLDRSSGEDRPSPRPRGARRRTTGRPRRRSSSRPCSPTTFPAVGALLSEKEELDVERAPWHFESDDTLVIPPEPGEAEPSSRKRWWSPRSSSSSGTSTSRRRWPGRTRGRHPCCGVRGRGIAIDSAEPTRAQGAGAPHDPGGRDVAHGQREHGRDRRSRHAGGRRVGPAPGRRRARLFLPGHRGLHGHRHRRDAPGRRRGLCRLPAGPIPPGHAARPGGLPLPGGRDLQQGGGGAPARPGPPGGRLVRLVPGQGGTGGRPGVRPDLDRLRLRLDRGVRLLRRPCCWTRRCSPIATGSPSCSPPSS